MHLHQNRHSDQDWTVVTEQNLKCFRDTQLKSSGGITVGRTCCSAFLLLFCLFFPRCAADEESVVSNFCVLFCDRSGSGFREDSWFKSLFVRKVDPRKDAHSHLLAKKEDSNLYKIQCMCLGIVDYWI